MNEIDESKPSVSVITLNMQAGSGGALMGRRLAELTGYRYYHQEIRKLVAESIEVAEEVTEAIEKQRLSGIQDFISSLVNDRYLWRGVYVQHLYEVVEDLADKGSAVLVGRGANFILPPEERFAIRIVAPLDMRVANVCRTFGVDEKEARKRVVNRDSRREAFVKQAYQSDINDPLHYDMVINTGNLSIDAAARAVIKAMRKNTGRTVPPEPATTA